MTALLESPILGVQRPRIYSAPPYVTTLGHEAIDLCGLAGLDLDEWQQLVLLDSLGQRADGKWSAPDVAEIVARQNGKGGTIEGRELAGLYLVPTDRVIIHTAHEFSTSLEAFERLLNLIDNSKALSKRVKRVSRAHGQEGITLRNGKRIRFRTRTKGGARGLTGDCLILDEAMELAEAKLSSAFPTLRARPNAQVWYLGSAVDQLIHENGIVFARVRERGHAGDPTLAFYEFSPDLEIDKITKEDTANRFYWAEANPALGHRISLESVERDRNNMSTRSFAVECLSVGDWPDTSEGAQKVIDSDKWKAGRDDHSAIVGPICYAFDVTPDRSWSAIAACGLNAQGLAHIEVITHKRGTSWVAKRIKELKVHNPTGIFVDAKGPAGAIVADVEKELGFELDKVTAGEHAQSLAIFMDRIENNVLRHSEDEELDAAVDGAATRPIGDGGVLWSRKDATVNISPLVAVTLALGGLARKDAPVVSRVINLNDY